jgi:hypothetical protein
MAEWKGLLSYGPADVESPAFISGKIGNCANAAQKTVHSNPTPDPSSRKVALA